MSGSLTVSPRDRETLIGWTRSRSVRLGVALRAHIVLLAAEGRSTDEIARRVGVSKPTVIGWTRRYATEGIAGLADRPRSGRRSTVDEVEIVLRTLQPPPDRLGVERWSSRLLAGELGVSHTAVGKVWKAFGLRPWRDDRPPESMVGRYLDPSAAVVVFASEPVLGRRLDVVVHSGEGPGELPRFLEQVALRQPRGALQVLCSGYVPSTGAMLAGPRATLHRVHSAGPGTATLLPSGWAMVLPDSPPGEETSLPADRVDHAGACSYADRQMCSARR